MLRARPTPTTAGCAWGMAGNALSQGRGNPNRRTVPRAGIPRGEILPTPHPSGKGASGKTLLCNHGFAQLSYFAGIFGSFSGSSVNVKCVCPYISRTGIDPPNRCSEAEELNSGQRTFSADTTRLQSWLACHENKHHGNHGQYDLRVNVNAHKTSDSGGVYHTNFND